MQRNDLRNSLLIGFFIGIILTGIAGNVGISLAYLWLAIPVFPVLAALVMKTATVLAATTLPVLVQASRFLMVGALNTFVDLGVLNLLIFMTGVAAGLPFTAFKGVSFVAAVLNSYLWNRSWTFPHQHRAGDNHKGKGTEFSQFLAVSAVGFVLNVGVASVVVNAIPSPESVSPNLWANAGAVAAALAALTWNFLGYKLIVFAK